MTFDENVVGECGSSDIHDAHQLENGEQCYGVHELSDYSNFEWITLPVDVPEGEEPGSGYWVRYPGQDKQWIRFADEDESARFFLDGPQSSQAMTAAHSDTPPPSVPGGSRARRAGFRLGRILGILVKGLVNLRGLNKKKLMEEDGGGDMGSGRGYRVDDDENWYWADNEGWKRFE